MVMAIGMVIVAKENYCRYYGYNYLVSKHTALVACLGV
jgi:hypothetical protein